MAKIQEQKHLEPKIRDRDKEEKAPLVQDYNNFE
jgi:hypothetical protein